MSTIPISQLKVVIARRCHKPTCKAYHWICPDCGEEGSIRSHKVTPIFTVICDKTEQLFLVDAREEWERMTTQ